MLNLWPVLGEIKIGAVVQVMAFLRTEIVSFCLPIKTHDVSVVGFGFCFFRLDMETSGTMTIFASIANQMGCFFDILKA